MIQPVGPGTRSSSSTESAGRKTSGVAGEGAAEGKRPNPPTPGQDSGVPAIAVPRDLLNDYTRRVIDHAIAVTLPAGWTVMVAADSDLVVSHPLSGEWVGFRLIGGVPERAARWRPVRGSLIAHVDPEFDDLTRAINFYVGRQREMQSRVRR